MKITQKDNLIYDFTTGSVSKQLIRFAAPLFFSGLLQTVYSMVDMVVVGRFVGSSGLSAVSIGGEVLTLLTFVATGLANAGQIILSQYIGAGQNEKVGRIIGTLFTFLLGCAVIISFLCLILRARIVQWVNTPQDAESYALSYITICICGLIFIYGYNLISAILRGMGDSHHPFLFIAAASGINLILDLLFIAVFRWEVFGAGLATVIGQSVSCILALVFLYRRKEQFLFDFKLSSFRIDGEIFPLLIQLGIPMVLQSAAITFSKLFITSWINSYGVIASAVTGVGNKLLTVTNVFSQAFSTAGGSMIAQNIGAQKYERVPRIISTALCLDVLAVVPFGFITIVWPQVVFALFTNEAEVLEMAVVYAPVAALMFGSCILRPPLQALINGSGNSKMNLAIALLDGIFVRIGLTLILGLTCGFGIYGFWYGSALSSYMPFVIGGIYYLTGRWKKQYLFKE